MALVDDLVVAIDNGFNIIMMGPHGIGKTMTALEAVARLDLTMKYYSTPTLDPYVDLVGVPMPIDGEHGKELEMVRPRFLDDVEVVMFDELNRSDPKTQNAVFEIIQFKAINGEPLPKLKAVIAGINPTGGDYKTEALDPALLDRFHIYFDMKASSPKKYLDKKYDKDIVKAFVNWWTQHNADGRDFYISPRRLEYMVDVWTKTGKYSLLQRCIPPNEDVAFADLKSKIAAAKRENVPEALSEYGQDAFWIRENVVRDAEAIRQYIIDNPADGVVISNAIEYLSGSIGVDKIVNEFYPILCAIQHVGRFSSYLHGLTPAKRTRVENALQRRLSGSSDDAAEEMLSYIDKNKEVF